MFGIVNDIAVAASSDEFALGLALTQDTHYVWGLVKEVSCIQFLV